MPLFHSVANVPRGSLAGVRQPFCRFYCCKGADQTMKENPQFTG